MKKATLVIALGLAACSDAREPLAQCQLAANGAEGMAFRKNYLDGQAPAHGDASYREFMLTCMPAKGWNFKSPQLSGPDPCWLPDPVGGIPDANVSEADCYSR